MGKALTIGVAIGVAVSFFGVGGAFLAAGQGWGAAIGMGAFVAFWGGLGFGVMVGGVVWATQAEKAAEQERRETSGADVTDKEAAEHTPRSFDREDAFSAPPRAAVKAAS